MTLTDQQWLVHHGVKRALRAWNCLGFGMFAIDAMWGLDPIQRAIAVVRNQRAGFSDIKEVMELHESLRQYIKGSPIFVLQENSLFPFIIAAILNATSHKEARKPHD